MDLDWNAIRSLNGSQSGGFEELCAQLARAERPADAKFERKGTPDAGVECYCVLANGDEWGWQAKYFDSLGSSQWSQLDHSVKTALDKHPALVRYFICVPMDRPDARSEGQKSAMQRWDEHVEKWESWATDRGMDVEFLWWGSFELLDILSRTEHIGRVYFWFGNRGFDQAWFQDRLKEAVNAAGPRYTPEVHVDLPIARELETFARTDTSFDRIKAIAREVRREFQKVSFPDSGDGGARQNFDLDELLQSGKIILKEFAALESTPVDNFPFSDIAEKIKTAESLADEVIKNLDRLSQGYEPENQDGQNRSIYLDNPYRRWLHRIYSLQSELCDVRTRLSEAYRVANSHLMVLKGEAGTGKTHLLCDVARTRIESGAPTLLLMGQRFLSLEDPWTQALQHLDMGDATVEIFVGSLESAAQAANCRALVVVDALNEGRGREIWPAHLSPFLARLEKSPWIGVVLSVRSTYEEAVISQDVRDGAVTVTHQGFEGEEYDAVRTFFSYYDLEFPSTPILQPEFRNPLFLKIICEGLRAKGEPRLPRGIHGITSVFDLYLDAINESLAESLDYNPRDNLVRRALDKIAERLVETGGRWLARTQAEEVVNELLLGRDYSRSLYQGLVIEGVLTEDIDWRATDPSDEVTFISYDRFMDHVLADLLLHSHLDRSNPGVAFAEDGGLAFLCEDERYALGGLLEAMCIQVPEQTGNELVRLAPKLIDSPYIGEAFLQSIVWRKLDAFSEDTRTVFNEFNRDQRFWTHSLDMLMTVSTVPSHRFNADFLDELLQRDSMPDRDAWWSTYLHRARGDKGPVDRLVDWASSISEDHDVEDSVIDLTATTLAWMFTTPNRFLRDRATKSLVALLTDRLDSTTRLVARFADVDDPYVTERIYAVAYGVAMRSHDGDAVGKLTLVVHENVFAHRTPPPHILLRDYARGVIERALHLGSELNLNERVIRPTYQSVWPIVPDEDNIHALESKDFPTFHSVTSGDFGVYVIGGSNGWISLSVNEDEWKSPEDRLQAWIIQLSESEHEAWEKVRETENDIRLLEMAESRYIVVGQRDESSARDQNSSILEVTIETPKKEDPKLGRARQELVSRNSKLLSTLTADHRTDFEAILEARNDDQQRHAPNFDSSIIRRYVLWRVFDLGWTSERFECFDHSTIRYMGRQASKPERIGKKYQWIAYHEILAYISDHYQYRGWYGGDEGDRTYEGPWQESLRDIDPSCTLLSIPGGTSWEGHRRAWWGVSLYEDWKEEANHQDWIKYEGDIPAIADELAVTGPDGTRWINLNAYFLWKQHHPPDVEPTDVDRREMWLSFTGYFVRADDADAFMDWAKDEDFWGNWMPNVPYAYLYDMFLGEYGWAPAFRYCDRQFYQDHGGMEWVKPKRECPADVQPASFEYRVESNGFDCSVDDSYTLSLPHHRLLDSLGLKWSGRGADYLDGDGKLAAFDPTVHEDGPSTLLVREDLLRQYLSREGLSLCWTVIGEKWVIGPRGDFNYQGDLRMTGAYKYEEHGHEGFIHTSHQPPHDSPDRT